MSNKKLKKFVVIDPSVFEKIKSMGISEVHLTTLEKSLLKILKNKSISTDKRLKFYKHLLFQNMRQDNVKKDLELKSLQQHQSAAPTHANPSIIKKSISMDPVVFPLHSADVSTQTKYNLKKNVGLDPIEYEKREGASRLSSTRIDDEDIYEHDADELDVDKERDDMLNSIKEMAGNDVNLYDLSFKHLEDPDKDYISIENKKSGDNFSIDKSPALIKAQQKKEERARKKIIRRGELETLESQIKQTRGLYPMLSPSKSGFSTRSGKMRWNPYEHM